MTRYHCAAVAAALFTISTHEAISAAHTPEPTPYSFILNTSRGKAQGLRKQAPSDAPGQAPQNQPDQDTASEHLHHHTDLVTLPPALGANLLEGWLDPWPHSHYSRSGAPFIHPFAGEPAFLGREIFLDFAITTGDEGVEREIELEIEYALTRRIGIVIEAGYTWIDPKGERSERGPLDLGIVPRFLLIECDNFLLSTNIAFEFPTGDEDRDLGAGETVFGPSLAAWLDLGAGISLQLNLGTEHGLSSGDSAIAWGGALTYSFETRPNTHAHRAHDGLVHAHYPPGLLSLIAEMRGEHGLHGEEEGITTATMILGASYAVTPHVNIRGGWMFTPWKPREFDHGGIIGFVYHF